jgi:hypothetical protein
MLKSQKEFLLQMKYLTPFKVTKTFMFIILEDTRKTDTHHSRPIPSNLKQPG